MRVSSRFGRLLRGAAVCVFVYALKRFVDFLFDLVRAGWLDLADFFNRYIDDVPDGRRSNRTIGGFLTFPCDPGIRSVVSLVVVGSR